MKPEFIMIIVLLCIIVYLMYSVNKKNNEVANSTTLQILTHITLLHYMRLIYEGNEDDDGRFIAYLLNKYNLNDNGLFIISAELKSADKELKEYLSIRYNEDKKVENWCCC